MRNLLHCRKLKEQNLTKTKRFCEQVAVLDWWRHLAATAIVNQCRQCKSTGCSSSHCGIRIIAHWNLIDKTGRSSRAEYRSDPVPPGHLPYQAFPTPEKRYGQLSQIVTKTQNRPKYSGHVWCCFVSSDFSARVLPMLMSNPSLEALLLQRTERKSSKSSRSRSQHLLRLPLPHNLSCRKTRKTQQGELCEINLNSKAFSDTEEKIWNV